MFIGARHNPVTALPAAPPPCPPHVYLPYALLWGIELQVTACPCVRSRSLVPTCPCVRIRSFRRVTCTVQDNTTAGGEAGDHVEHELDEYMDLVSKNVSANKIPLITGVVFVVWIFLLTLFYRYGAKLRFSQAFFFSLDSGLSIGYGAEGINCENSGMAVSQGVCEFASVLNIWIMTLLFTVLLGTIASMKVINKQETLKHSHTKAVNNMMKDKLKEHMASLDVIQHDHTAKKSQGRITPPARTWENAKAVASKSQIITSRPFFKMAPKSGFELCFACSTDQHR